MSEPVKLIAIFSDIDLASAAIDKLKQQGITDDHIEVISGIPFSERILGRPEVSTVVPRLALAGAIGGLALAVFLVFGTPALYPLRARRATAFPISPIDHHCF